MNLACLSAARSISLGRIGLLALCCCECSQCFFLHSSDCFNKFHKLVSWSFVGTTQAPLLELLMDTIEILVAEYSRTHSFALTN